MFHNPFLASILCLVSVMLSGCLKGDDMPPAAPRGAYSVTGDGQILVGWYPNQEKDLKGYTIYRCIRGSEDYSEIAKVSSETARYLDFDVANGTTYYYSISAFDRHGNESDMCPESVEDTPRPEGTSVRLEDYSLKPDRSGFDLSHPENGSQKFDLPETDIYFGFDTKVSASYIYSNNKELGMQDLGYTNSIGEVDAAPTQGFVTLFVEAIVGHTYAFLTPDGHYAKIRVTDLCIEQKDSGIQEIWLVFDWAYQLQAGNPEL